MLKVKYSPPCVPIHATINDLDLACLRAQEVNVETGGESYCYPLEYIVFKENDRLLKF